MVSVTTAFAAMMAAVDGLGDAAPIWMPLANAGGFGLCLAWFMLRNERWLQRLTLAHERSARVELLMIMSLKTLDAQHPVKMLGAQLAKELGTNDEELKANENFADRR